MTVIIFPKLFLCIFFASTELYGSIYGAGLTGIPYLFTTATNHFTRNLRFKKLQRINFAVDPITIFTIFPYLNKMF